jgi:hypothetical protein
MDSKIKAQWVTALRSGEYHQGCNTLRTNLDGYCCLGVLCDIVNPKQWHKDKYAAMGWAWSWGTKHTEGMPTANLLKRVGLSQNAADDLSTMNDSGETFAAIADHIEREL